MSKWCWILLFKPQLHCLSQNGLIDYSKKTLLLATSSIMTEAGISVYFLLVKWILTSRPPKKWIAMFPLSILILLLCDFPLFPLVRPGKVSQLCWSVQTFDFVGSVYCFPVLDFIYLHFHHHCFLLASNFRVSPFSSSLTCKLRYWFEGHRGGSVS